MKSHQYQINKIACLLVYLNSNYYTFLNYKLKDLMYMNAKKLLRALRLVYLIEKLEYLYELY